MNSFVLSVAADGRVAKAPAGAALGANAGGAVYQLINVPGHFSVEDVLDIANGFIPAEGIERVDFAKLASKRMGSCCGSCA